MKKFYQLNKIIFLIIIFLFSINIKNVIAADEPDILCPNSGEEPTEILIYYHGLLKNQHATCAYNYLSNEESLNVFSGEINKIRSAIPGIVGVHIRTNACLSGSSCVYYDNLATILSAINTSCNISNAASLPLSLAGHSNGGGRVNLMKSSATNKVIFLDALYGDYTNTVECEKLIIVGGQTNHPDPNHPEWGDFKIFTDNAVNRCHGKTGFIYEEGQWTSINDHYNTIGRLSALYTGAEGLTSTKPEFVKSPDLNPLGQLNIKIPGIDELVAKYPIVCEGDDKESCKIPWIGIYIYALYNYLLGIGGVLAAIALMIGGVLWLISAGNANRVSQAKSWITGSLTGLVILLTSYVLLYEINPELLGMKYIEMETIVSASPCAGMDLTADNPYQAGCIASEAAEKAGTNDWSVCKSMEGQIPPNLILVDAALGKQYINKDVYAAFQRAMECVREKNGGKDMFVFAFGWRSPAGQIAVKEQWTADGKPENASSPCCSNHGSGVAMDLRTLEGRKNAIPPMTWEHNESSGLKECMNEQGLYANLTCCPNEPWHWSPTGY
jgi:hypothetical protein